MELQDRPRAFPPVITASLREAFNSCHKKFEWTQIIGISPKNTSIHLTAGKAYAAGLEAYRAEFFTPSDLPEPDRYNSAVAKGLIALTQAYGKEDPLPEEKKQYDRVVAAYVEHLVRYLPDRDRNRRIAEEAVQLDAHVQRDDVTVFELPRRRDAVHDLLVDRRAQRRRVAAISLERRLRSARPDQTLGGFRMQFLAGNRESPNAPNNNVGSAGIENLTADGETMFLRAVVLAANNGAIPEPGTAALAALASLALLRRRRRS